MKRGTSIRPAWQLDVTGEVLKVAVTSLGGFVVIASGDGTVRWLEPRSGRVVRTDRHHEAPLTILEAEHDSDAVWTCDTLGNARRWLPGSDGPVDGFRGTRGTVKAIRPSHSGSAFYLLERTWGIHSRLEGAAMESDADFPALDLACIAAPSAWIVAADTFVALHHAETRTAWVFEAPARIAAMATSLDSPWVLASTVDGGLHALTLLDDGTGTAIEIDPLKRPPSLMRVSPTNDMLWLADGEQLLGVQTDLLEDALETPPDQRERVPPEVIGRTIGKIRAMAVANSGRRVALGSARGEVQVLGRGFRHPAILEAAGKTAPITHLAFTVDSDGLVVAGPSRPVACYRTSH
jgi:hypothetical protein